jgi:hypothetical protein
MEKLMVVLYNFASATNSGVSGIRKISENTNRKLAIGDRLQAPNYLSRVIIIGKSEPENKEQISGNTPL